MSERYIRNNCEIKSLITVPIDSNLLCFFELSALRSDVGFGVGSWSSWGGSEMFLGLSVLGSSKKQSVSSYFNI